ncbi:MAG: alternative ribosome rescue aminoacyl-tRNA hydrolase ArfB [Proteobacteria bacterium]|nr:alternative ribosome rescue aminoacyl-tRNA hydrolase ArfB [Pseudomonadota bacterium]
MGRARLADDELDFSFARSSGPGGQNVNKTNSKAILSWSLDDASTISEAVKFRFRAAFPNKVTEDGRVVIASDETRDRMQNQERCIEKLLEMLESVWVAPKIRKPTKPTKSSQRRRVETKRQRTETKGGRGKVRAWKD